MNSAGAILLIVHGIVHLIDSGVYLHLPERQEMPDTTSQLGGFRKIGDVRMSLDGYSHGARYSDRLARSAGCR